MSDLARQRPAAPYLRESNYYRLAYQLAAQQAHGGSLAEVESVEGRDPSKTAEDLVADIARILGWFELRQARARFRPKLALSASELRLQRFLAGTVEPCTLLILAARSVHGVADPLDYVEKRRRPRERVTYQRFSRRSIVLDIPWSYRVYYNLACSRAQYLPDTDASDAVRDDDDTSNGEMELLLGGALSALDQAFRRVHGRPRVELWRWAARDPSLSRLRKHRVGKKQFKFILSEYAAPGEAAKSSRGA
jgi:hypothetical protein